MSVSSAKAAPTLKDALELLADAIDEIIGLESLRALCPSCCGRVKRSSLFQSLFLRKRESYYGLDPL